MKQLKGSELLNNLSRIACLSAMAIMLTFGAAGAEELTENWRLGGFELPESVLADPANNRIIIGNMKVFGPDGGMDGYLSLVSEDGELIEKEWVTGLMDPKGMAIVGDSLYVADPTGLIEISLSEGAIVSTIPLEGAIFPNDVTVDNDGTIYVSDFLGEAIYRVKGGAAERWLEDENLTLPNGLYFSDGMIFVGSMGENMDMATFQAETPGGILIVDIENETVTAATNAAALGGLDGVGELGGMIITNDNATGTIYAWDASDDMQAESVAVVGPAAGDMSTNGDNILVPMLMTGELISLQAGM